MFSPFHSLLTAVSTCWNGKKSMLRNVRFLKKHHLDPARLAGLAVLLVFCHIRLLQVLVAGLLTHVAVDAWW